MTQAGVWIALVTSVARVLELDIDEGVITELVLSVGSVVAICVAYYGRYRQGDINWYGKKVK